MNGTDIVCYIKCKITFWLNTMMHTSARAQPWSLYMTMLLSLSHTHNPENCVPLLLWNSQYLPNTLFCLDPHRITQTPTQCVRLLKHKHTACSAVIATSLLQMNCWHPSITFQDVRLPMVVRVECFSSLDHENECLTTYRAPQAPPRDAYCSGKLHCRSLFSIQQEHQLSEWLDENTKAERPALQSVWNEVIWKIPCIVLYSYKTTHCTDGECEIGLFQSLQHKAQSPDVWSWR